MTHPMTQAEGARPFTITNATNTGRISVNGAPERWKILPFAEFFHLFNRNYPGAIYLTNIALLPVVC
jgi:hypothetical protein